MNSNDTDRLNRLIGIISAIDHMSATEVHQVELRCGIRLRAIDADRADIIRHLQSEGEGQ